jgi:hypothetical protein
MKAAYLTHFAALGLLGLTACSPDMPAGRATLGPDPALGGGFYTSPGGLTVAVDARNIGGRTGICGVWAESENQSVMTKNAARQVLDSGGVTLGGEGVAHGLGFLRKVAPARSYAGLEANCITTDRAWRSGDEARPLRVHLPRQIVRNEIDMDAGDSGGIVIWFRPSGPGAHPSDKTPW